jgi:hypothetical protein
MAMGPGFRIVEGPQDAKWFPIATANTVMVGQIVKYSANTAGQGVMALGASTTAGEVTANGVPFGIVIAVNNRTPLSNSTYSTQYATQVNTQAGVLARDYFGVEGMFGKGDPMAMALVEILTPISVIEGPIMKTSYGTAPGIVTCSSVDTNGLTGMVHSAGDAAAYEPGNNMYYCRSGNNTGIYRSANAVVSNTTPTFEQPWPYCWTANDTFAMTNFGLGRNRIQLQATYGMYIDNAANVTAGGYHFKVFVLSMDLTKAGQETAQFRFEPYLS